MLFRSVGKECFCSHQGLTYGGLLLDFKAGQSHVLEIFSSIISYLKNEGFKTFVYKCIPEIYHKIPAQEDLYALFCNDALLINRKPSCSINFAENPGFRPKRRGKLNKALRENFTFEQITDLSAYWPLLEGVLDARFESRPVHTLEEMTLLMNRFPDNIKCFVAKKDDRILAGTVIYETEITAHTQYMATNEEGRERNALVFLLDRLINDIYKDCKWFDFGTSTESDPKILNHGLIHQKESFGASATMYDIYEMNL